MSGFIAANPQLSFTEKGDARFYARVGQEHFRRNEDGTFTKLETTFHDLVQFRRAAERSYAQFQKGDHFVAEGRLREFSYEADGETIEREEFIARKIGHDTARTTYTVDRTRNVSPGKGHGIKGVDQVTPPTEAPESESQSDPAKRKGHLAYIDPAHETADTSTKPLTI